MDNIQNDKADKTSSSSRNKSKRLLLKGMAAAPIVASLPSRSAWGNNCSLSGLLSGNLSNGHTYECTPGQGQTPGFWMNHPETWPSPYTPGYSNDPDGVPSSSFLNIFGSTSSYGNTLMDILDPQACDNGAGSLEFHLIAALLSAAHPDVNYGYQPQEIIDAFVWVMTYKPEKAGELHDILAELNERTHVDAKALITNPEWDRAKLGRVVDCSSNP